MSGNEIVTNNQISNAHITYQSPKSVTLKAGFSYKQAQKAEFKAIVSNDILSDCKNALSATIAEDEIFDLDYSYTEANNVESTKTITIYPNPTTGDLTIALGENVANVTITDVIGNVISSQKASEDLFVDMSSYPKGIYLVKVVTENDSYIEKVVLK